MGAITLRSLGKTYPDGTPAVRQIDLDVEDGQFVVLLGPSGCGKTTTLRMIAGLEIPTRGSIRLGGQDVTGLPPEKRDVGFVFQFYALYPQMTVLENIAFPLEAQGLDRAAREQEARGTAEALELAHLLDAYPRSLSGGDQQRVSLARAMVRHPQAFLMDEPLGTLDADQRDRMREFIRGRQLESKTTTVYVTHDQEEAMSLADKVVVMKEGRVLQAASPSEIYDHPADLFVAHFVGSPGMNFVEGIIQSQGGSRRLLAQGGQAMELPPEGPQEEGPWVLGFRPEFLRPQGDGPIRGTLVSDASMGGSRLLHVDCPMGRVTCRVPQGPPRKAGQSLSLALDPKGCRFFNPKSQGLWQP